MIAPQRHYRKHPRSNPTTVCPNCGTEGRMEVVGKRLVGEPKPVVDRSVKCRECGRIHHEYDTP